MAAKTQQKANAKRAAAKSSKPKAKPSAKRAPAKSSAKTSKPKATAKAKSAAKRAPSVETSKRDATAAEKATKAMRSGNGESSRAPVNATQVALVRGVVGRSSVATIAKRLGFESQAQLVKHANGKLANMPAGSAAKFAEFYDELPAKPGASKIRGRKLTAIIAHL